ncbi:MAG: hypothetical protein WBB26_14785 [Saprospiraceae bacterium]
MNNFQTAEQNALEQQNAQGLAAYREHTALCSIIRDTQLFLVDMQHRINQLQKSNPDLPFELPYPIE